MSSLQPQVQPTTAPRPPADPYLVRIRDVVYQVAGIYHSEDRLHFLAERCQRRMKALKVGSLAEYFDLLTVRPQRDAELRSLLDEITVGETSFFRYPLQLEALRRVVLPAVVQAKARLGFTRLRIWSAGCSSGEEPHTLAMIVAQESAQLLKGWSVEILATDLSERALSQARTGIYSEYALRNVPVACRQQYLRPYGGQFQVVDSIREAIVFTRLNLLDDSKMLFMKGMDVILCCNVMIYFDGAAKRRVLQHFHSNLLPNGYLFLGHSESLFGINSDFRLVHFPGTTAYLKAGSAPAIGGTP